MRKKIIFLFLILIFVLGVTGFWYYHKNTYSKETLKLEILGPVETELAQEVEYMVRYKNNGAITLENPRLIFEYPQNSIVTGEESPAGTKSVTAEKSSLRQEKELEDIYPGQEQTFRFKARLFGEEGEGKIAKVWLSYQPKNLKARYESTTSLVTTIKKVPITFEFDFSSKIESGKESSFRINYFSNTDYLLKDLGIHVDYPSGFEFIQSTPKSIDKTDWKIPVLNKSEGGRIEIKGRFSGEIGSAKVFRARLGIWREGEFILLKEIERGVEIIKPSIYIRQEINGNPNFVALPGDWLHYKIYFKNIGDDVLNNLFMACKLEGEAFDFQTLKSDLGEYQLGDNSVIFDWRKIPKLQHLIPMEEGEVDFFIKVKDDLGGVEKMTLVDKVFIGQAKEVFTTRIGSKLEIVQKAYFQDEVFGNSGPLPPEVGKATTYTIMWHVKNYYADVKNVKVKGRLPQGVELTGKIFPEEEILKFTFDSKSREIVWLVGDLEKTEEENKEGYSKKEPNISFQVKFMPKETQRGETPLIIDKAVITGEDALTETTIESSSPGINTTLPDDPTVNESMSKVQ